MILPCECQEFSQPSTFTGGCLGSYQIMSRDNNAVLMMASNPLRAGG